jgi:hypothetical protein
MRWDYNLTDMLRRPGFPHDHDLNYCRAFRRDLAATFPNGSEAESRPGGKGGYFITLPHGVINRL